MSVECIARYLPPIKQRKGACPFASVTTVYGMKQHDMRMGSVTRSFSVYLAVVECLLVCHSMAWVIFDPVPPPRKTENIVKDKQILRIWTALLHSLPKNNGSTASANPGSTNLRQRNQVLLRAASDFLAKQGHKRPVYNFSPPQML